jgi:hypothetical protein
MLFYILRTKIDLNKKTFDGIYQANNNQPIESLFNCINESTQIQIAASKVRSSNVIKFHCM